MFVDPEISTQADGAQSSRVPVSLLEDPCEAIRHAYLVGTDTESESFEGEAETPESPHTVAPPTCHVGESEGSSTSDARSTSSDSTAPLSPDHPLTHTTHILVTSLRRTVRMAVRVSPVMSPRLSVSIAEMAAMPDLSFREEEDEEVEESSDSDSEREDTEDEGPAVEDEDPAAGDEGLAARDEGPSMRVASLGLVGDKTIPEGQQRAALVMETVMEPEKPEGVSALRQPTLTTWIDVKDALSIVPSPMISLAVPSPITSPATNEAEGFLTELGAHVEMQGGLIHDHTRYRFRSLEHEQERTVMKFGALWRHVLALEAWIGRVNTRMEDMSRAEYDDHRPVHDMFLQQAALQRELQEMRGRVTDLEQERDRMEQ
uniref:Uncharacterized protein n=1 Tax=Tanacetum cinerariifolium TaxID=118510 RepID=A0A699J0Z7_TANCI|nr:hypothetical protein [Tanacetum cinerariifolium]